MRQAPVCQGRATQIDTSGEGKKLRVEGPSGAFGKLDRVLGARFFSVQLKCQLYKPVDQLCIGQARSFPQLRIHADGCKTGNGIQLVDVHLAAAALEEKITTRHSAAVDGAERAH